MTDDELFEAGGGYDFADKVASGLDERITETIKTTGRASVGVMTNSIELAWLIDAYQRLRKETAT